MKIETVYWRILQGFAIVVAFFFGLVLMKNENFYAVALGWVMVITSPLLVIKYLKSVFEVQSTPDEMENVDETQ